MRKSVSIPRHTFVHVGYVDENGAYASLQSYPPKTVLSWLPTMMKVVRLGTSLSRTAPI